MKSSLGLWKIQMLKAPSGYAAAIACKGKGQNQATVMQEEIKLERLFI